MSFSAVNQWLQYLSYMLIKLRLHFATG